MSALGSVQAAALLAVADAIKSYADEMYWDDGYPRLYERDIHIQEQFHALAEHLRETAEHTIKMSQDVEQA